MEREKVRYLVVVELAASSNMQRIGEDVPHIMHVMRRLSDTEPTLAFRSKDGLLFGVFIRSNVAPAVIRAEFEKSDGSRNGDHMMAFDVGQRLTGTSGFGRAWTWLQHH